VKFDFKDFNTSRSAGLETIVRVANQWAAENGVVVMNVETLTAFQHDQSSIRVWYRVP
jgi:hypothetical protein